MNSRYRAFTLGLLLPLGIILITEEAGSEAVTALLHILGGLSLGVYTVLMLGGDR